MTEPDSTTTRALLLAIEQMGEGVIVADASGRILFVNDAAAEMHGSRQLGVGIDSWTSAYSLLTEQGDPYPDRELPLARAALKGETITNARWRVRRPDGTEILAIGSAHPVVDDAGHRIGAVLTMTDGTAREKARQLEHERNALALELQNAFHQSPRSAVIYDANGKVIAVNQSFERLWGATLADVPPEYSVLNDPQLAAAGVTPTLRRAFGLDGARSADGPGESVITPPVRYEMADTTGKGRTIWTQAHAYPVRDSAGNIVRVILTHEDITDRRTVEVAREQKVALQVLTEVLSQASTTDEMSSAIVRHAAPALGAAGVVVARQLADQATLELLDATGMPEGIRLEWTSFPLDAPVPLAEVARTGEALYLESREMIVARYPHLADLFAATGHNASAILPLTINDRSLGVLGAAYETPQTFDEEYRAVARTLARLCAQALDRARLFESERAAREAAEEANRAKSEFLAIMSHELRTPLNAIGGYAELMEMGIRGPVTHEQRTDLQRIQRSQRHLLGLVNGVLNYSRVEAGAVSYEMNDIVLGDLLRNCEALVTPQAREKNLELTHDIPAEDIFVRADAEKLQQIVLNLLANAIKFTEPGGSVSLEASRSEEFVRVSVVDTGVGIPDSQISRIFEPFVQVDTRLTRANEGVGLGLAISRDLARGMGGEISARSVVGVGSTFTLTLPRSV